MKVLTLWLGAFWFAINRVLGENNPNKDFYAYELNKEIKESLKRDQEHPYFFSWYKLPKNIKVIDNYDSLILEVDLLIVAIPAQFISKALSWLENKLKDWVVILNLAKWIDISSNKTISELLKESLIWLEYNYTVLSWWMIAKELVEWKILWADLWIKDKSKWNEIKKLLENNNFEIKLRQDIINVELYWSLKNIAAIIVWYYEWKWLEKSSIWYYLLKFLDEMKEIVWLYWWNKNIDFSYYSLWGDIIATCFWNSRNRYFWQLLWKWMDVSEVLKQLKNENKHAEWYETIKAVYEKIKYKKWFEITKFIYELIK